MRTRIVHIGAQELTYEIRNIIRVADKLKEMGVEVYLENIGDPVAKGEKVPIWMKQIVSKLVMEDECYGYCPSQGLLETRQFLVDMNNSNGHCRITPDDIIFFNGLGDAITKVYGFLRRTARVITPSPTYTTHSSSEAAHAGLPPVCYPLDPNNNWFPDIDELRRRVKYNPAVAGILLINPDNPTGTVFPESILKAIVAIAEEFNLFIIADEIYQNLIYNGKKSKPLAAVIGDVPAISMKGISKELPWPGSRCGWIEVYNARNKPEFSTYIQTIVGAKMVEVCSTTLPQKAFPHIVQHPKFQAHLGERRLRYERFSGIAYKRLKKIPGILVNRTDGAFYMSIVFKDGKVNGRQSLPISNPSVRSLIENLIDDPKINPDKRFVYYLLGATGICLVPLSSFNTDLQGFRMTLLEPDEKRFCDMIDTLGKGIEDYINSAE
ncbi:pyridoxal phosphate-dependent aminotransferase [Desulfobacula phenolica]|uniref:alanine transaminase n=1 Tax=Desulfobacula phenolica TaxID=90732 RepID=A0A1H2FP18_9BACT|nr:pyridoxal phosphate-dependent aminotransferase [Desulfobacula phenolica]SDU09080.1 Aspartate/methionine/tyrosine aminotransferase [Desulfobacula phenolica]